MKVMPVINPTTIDLEIQQYLIQTGVDRDTAVKTIRTWFTQLATGQQINNVAIVPVVNNDEQLHVQYEWSGASCSKVYDVTTTKRTNSAQTTPQAKKQPVLRGSKVKTLPGKPSTGVLPGEQPTRDRRTRASDNAEEAFDRAMKGL